MAFDGITVAGLCRELQDSLTGGRVYKIAQTDKNELVLTIRLAAERGGGQVRLYLSADPSLPVDDVVKEFGMETWREYYARTLKLKAAIH